MGRIISYDIRNEEDEGQVKKYVVYSFRLKIKKGKASPLPDIGFTFSHESIKIVACLFYLFVSVNSQIT